jgi:hypothetical protein
MCITDPATPDEAYLQSHVVRSGPGFAEHLRLANDLLSLCAGLPHVGGFGAELLALLLDLPIHTTIHDHNHDHNHDHHHHNRRCGYGMSEKGMAGGGKGVGLYIIDNTWMEVGVHCLSTVSPPAAHSKAHLGSRFGNESLLFRRNGGGCSAGVFQLAAELTLCQLVHSSRQQQQPHQPNE